MTHLFIQNADFHCIPRKCKGDSIKYKSIKAAKILQSSFQYKYRELKCIYALKSKDISKVILMYIQSLHGSIIYSNCGL